MIDRIVHHADVIALKGASYRIKHTAIDTALRRSRSSGRLNPVNLLTFLRAGCSGFNRRRQQPLTEQRAQANWHPIEGLSGDNPVAIVAPAFNTNRRGTCPMYSFHIDPIVARVSAERATQSRQTSRARSAFVVTCRTVAAHLTDEPGTTRRPRRAISTRECGRRRRSPRRPQRQYEWLGRDDYCAFPPHRRGRSRIEGDNGKRCATPRRP